jgi:hypothetical protein
MPLESLKISLADSLVYSRITDDAARIIES